MAIYDEINGKYVDLRPVSEEDAEFTLQIRQEPQFVKWLPRISQTTEKQKEWIKKQRGTPGDYFFIVYNKENEKIGTIAAYGMESDHPETGRLAIKGDAFENSEAMYLLQDFVFNTLNIKQTYGFIYADNKRAIRFNKQFGARIEAPSMDEQGRMICLASNTRDNFNEFVPKIRRMLYGADSC